MARRRTGDSTGPEETKLDQFAEYLAGRAADLSPQERAQFEDAAGELRDILKGETIFSPEQHEYFLSLVPPLPLDDSQEEEAQRSQVVQGQLSTASLVLLQEQVVELASRVRELERKSGRQGRIIERLRGLGAKRAITLRRVRRRNLMSLKRGVLAVFILLSIICFYLFVGYYLYNRYLSYDPRNRGDIPAERKKADMNEPGSLKN